MPKTPLQMLLRGQNLVGYRHYEDGVVDRFVQKAADNGIDVFRVFDALNDIRNLERAIKAVRRTGKHAQGTISYTTSPVHTIAGFVKLAVQLREIGAESICIKDMAALLKPQPAYDLVRALKAALGERRPRARPRARHDRRHAGQPDEGDRGRRRLRGHLHQLDEPRARATTRPSRWSRCSRARRTSRALDKPRLLRIKEHFARIRPRYTEFLSNITGVETEIFESQIPGGMISNMESQLKQQGAADRIKEVLAEVPHVRRDAGYPAARHAVQPDRRHAGGVQRDDGPLQGDDRRVRRPDARLLRRHDRAARPGGRRTSRTSTRRRSRSPAARPTC